MLLIHGFVIVISKACKYVEIGESYSTGDTLILKLVYTLNQNLTITNEDNMLPNSHSKSYSHLLEGHVRAENKIAKDN